MLDRLAAALAADPTGDADLVRRYAEHREAAAFAELVRRHGRVVWVVCRNLLPREADAEDAFQAVWLAFARSAGRVRQPAAVAGWLHGAAVKVGLRARRSAARRRKHEQTAGERPGLSRPSPAPSEWAELHAAVYAEADRLPARERAVFVLCGLHGVRQADAADRLGLRRNSVSGLLARGRRRVLAALAARGLLPTAAGAVVLAGTAGGCPPPAAVARRAVEVLGGATSDVVRELARGATEGTMRAKVWAAVLVVAGGGAAWLATAVAQGPGGFPGGGGSPNGSGGGPPGMSGPPATPSPAPALPAGGVEYQFVAKPTTAGQFKQLLRTQGADGWEYAGAVPYDGVAEVVFKRPARPKPAAAPGGEGGFGAMMGGMPGGAGMAGGYPGMGTPGGAGGPMPGMMGMGGPAMGSPGGTPGGPAGMPGGRAGGAKADAEAVAEGPIKAGEKMFDPQTPGGSPLFAIRDIPKGQRADLVRLRNLRASDLDGFTLSGVEMYVYPELNAVVLIGRDPTEARNRLRSLDRGKPDAPGR